jgi:hypothetical protein
VIDPRSWRWVQNWLAARRQQHLRRNALRQCTWCANGLHMKCRGWTTLPNLDPVDCLCPCATAAGHRVRG